MLVGLAGRGEGGKGEDGLGLYMGLEIWGNWGSNRWGKDFALGLGGWENSFHSE